MSEDNVKATVEALLFVSEKPVLIEHLHNVFKELEPAKIRAILEQMKAEYLDSKRGMRIIEVAGGFQMLTRPEYAGWVDKFRIVIRKSKLTQEQ